MHQINNTHTILSCFMKTCTPDQVDRMFKLSEQFVDQQIAERNYQTPRYWADMFPVKPFPDGVGLVLDKVRFFGDIGPQYDGFDGWRKVEVSRSATESAFRGEHNACGYKWEEVGHGLETVSYSLMQRDLRTRPICIKDIRTFFQYEEVQNMVYRNLANISANMREQLNRNAAMMFSVKYAALNGFPVNNADPYKFPIIPTNVKVGKLTYRLLKHFYPMLAQEAGQYAIDTINGAPAFGIIAHPDTLDQMAYEDSEIRQDIRLGTPRDGSLIQKYSFLEGMGQLIFMPDLYAPRYDFDTAGNLVRVMPFDRAVDIEIGTRPMTSAAYHNARFEFVQFMTRDLFSLRARKPLSSVGGETDFEAETAMLDWKWHNPPCKEDPYRRVGRYVTTAEIGIEPGDFTDIPGILVERMPGNNVLSYWPNATDCQTREEPELCEVTETEVCARIIGCCATVEDNQLLFSFDKAIADAVGESIDILLASGGSVSAEIISKSSDNKKLVLEFAENVACDPGAYVSIKCAEVGFCDSLVDGCNDCRSAATNAAKLQLRRPLRCMGVEDAQVKVYFGDGTTALMDIVSSNAVDMTISVRYATGPYGPTDDGEDAGSTYDLCCDRRGVKKVCCVDTEGCPACE